MLMLLYALSSVLAKKHHITRQVVAYKGLKQWKTIKPSRKCGRDLDIFDHEVVAYRGGRTSVEA